MKPADSLFFPKQPKDQIIFAAGEWPGLRETQEDVFLHFNDECFVIADGVGGLAHGEIAAKLAAETAIWGYKHIRLRPYYWADKRLLVRRIFRSANLAVWQKHRETGFEAGLAATLVVLILGVRTFWLGSIGDSSAFLFRSGILKKLTHDDIDAVGNLTKVVGLERFGLVPQFVAEDFIIGDSLVLATDGLTKFIKEEDLRPAAKANDAQSLDNATKQLLEIAQRNGGTDNMTVCIVKRIGLPH